MNLIEVKELFLNTDDAYILETFDNIIVTNDSNGLCLYDYHFNFIKKILWHYDVGVYKVYKNFFNNELLLDCSEDEILLYVDLNNAILRKITVEFMNEEKFFLGNLYYWHNNVITFKSSRGFIQVDVEYETVRFVSEDFIKVEHSAFFYFCEASERFSDIHNMPKPFIFVYTENEKVAGVYDFLNDKITEMRARTAIDHEVIYSNGLFAFINAAQLQLSSVDEGSYFFHASLARELLAGTFIENAQHYILLSTQFKDGKQEDCLTKFRIES